MNFRFFFYGPVLFVVLLLFGCKDFIVQNVLEDQSLKEKVELKFYDYAGSTYSLSGLKNWLNQRLAVDDQSPILFYLHGMGNFPKRAYRRKIFERMKDEYGVDMLLFHWPSYINFYTVPRLNARETKIDLGQAFQIINDVFKQRQKKPRLFFLAHSLGNEALREFVQYIYQTSRFGVFLEKMVLVSPDVALNGHSQWLEKIDFANNLYVLLSQKDTILELDKMFLNQKLLGIDFGLNGFKEIASNTNYFIFNQLTDDLEKNDEKVYWRTHTPHLFGNQKIKQFFDDLLNHDFRLNDHLKKTDFSRVYLFKTE